MGALVACCPAWVVAGEGGSSVCGVWRVLGGGRRCLSLRLSLPVAFNDGTEELSCVLEILPRSTCCNLSSQVLVFPISRMFWKVSVWLFYTLIRKIFVFHWHRNKRGMHPSFLLWVSIFSKYLDTIKTWRSMEI